jgi:hypothetical protein
MVNNNVGSGVPLGGTFSFGTRLKKRALTGLKGGKSPRATPPKSSLVRHGQSGYHAPVVKPVVSKPKPTPGLGSLPAAPPPKPPNIFDSTYFSERAQAEYNLGSQIADPEARIAGLERKNDSTGLTVYEQLLKSLKNRFQSDSYSNNSQLTSRGIFNSGARDVYAKQSGEAFQNEEAGLSNKFGAGAIRTLQDQVKAAKASHADYLANLALAAGARKSEQEAAADYSNPAALMHDPLKYVPKGWSKGKGGFFRANKQWHFVNGDGVIQNNVKAPGKNARIF